MNQVLLKADSLCKSFANNGLQNHVLDHIDLELIQGDFTVIMGSSGSGKSTLLYSLSGMDTVTSGKVLYQGIDITSNREKELSMLRRKEFGFIFQQMHLVSNLSLYENVAVSGYLLKQNSHKEVNERASELLDLVGLMDCKKRLPSQVSGGQQQRACIARAIINKPQLLFADEPTGALNKKSGIEILDLLTEINEEGQSILMVTHDVKAAIRANRILYLEDGKVVGDMKLPRYTKDNAVAAEKQVVAWLSARGW
ncbi:ABC transporter ATP-binding protein [Anaeromicropila herbilytica]|uniref:ABC transporter ATP-binding protein n=1 Tax=Anaeromicropila herbilytica TaxID=2785025 RepID=A0A7R7IBU2_9FIRM|nr:ABC transporter ATP-binding protein [Anaeromicropila herbilytica]BCN29947.1 ABC transporter ATP-binding protein [Anaeromicropila herbilytica]